MADKGISGLAIGATLAGGLLVYSGVTGKSWSSALQKTIAGQSPASATPANLITRLTVTPGSTTSITGLSGSAAGDAIAQDALRYQGAGYVWGGAPARGVGNWDCSSFTNWVVGHDVGLAIPLYARGTYDGSSHGPATGVWLTWTGCATIATNSTAKAVPGDIIVGVTHMGIYTGGGDYMSAHDPQDGTSNSPVQGGFPDPVYLVRRLRALM